MSLKGRLLEDMKAAMRDKDATRKNAIQMVRAAVLQVEKDNKVELDDEGIIEVIGREVKRRRDSLAEFEKTDRHDLINSLKSEIDILMAYLPEQLSVDEVENIVEKVINDLGITSKSEIGKIMKEVLPKVKGRADGRMVNQAVAKLLK